MFTKILTIDDSFFQRKYLRKCLGQYFSILEAATGADGIEILNKEKPDLVIVDNILNNESGYDICKKIRSDPQNTYLPVIMVSGMDKPADIKLGFESGINAYLTKPYKGEELLKIIRDFEDKGLKVRQEKILIIDDSPMIRSIISRSLKILGFTIIQAENGEQGVMKALEEKPDIITCDIEMPIMNGYDACKILKSNEKTKQIPIIMITTKSTQEEIAKGFECGITEYFTKPFKPEVLAAHIEKLVGAKHRQNGETILLVDDSKVSLNIYENILRYEGYNTMSAGDGEEALNIILNNYKNINLVICDIYMPKLNGLRLLEKLNVEKLVKPIPPFIFVSMAEDRNVAIEGLTLGAVDYITKPFDAVEFRLRVNNQIKIQRLLNQIKSEEVRE